ncbi:MAG: hypothetical protein O3A53_20805 [Acidobacteria bacterium]|nr:hypothetical protein [Acidobacteriota bacterium]MDA1237219.1 hypothetical protein [Acidobacteriota bacterium]
MNIYKFVPLALPFLLSACGASAFAGACLHEAPRDAGIAVDGATKVQVIAGAGSLNIVGKPGMSAVQAHGTACAAKKSQLDGIRLIAERRGDTLWIESVFEKGLSLGNRGLNFTVELPESLPLVVKDGSGALKISNVAALRLHDGSGAATISGVHGDLTVDDGSGGLDISDVHGSARIEDGSGALTVRKVEGPVDIEDGSGSIDIDHLSADLIVRDGSGSIRISDVEGDLTISEAGSGGLSVDNVAGRVDIPKKR